MYAARLSTRADLLSHVMDASALIRNDTAPFNELCYFTFSKGHIIIDNQGHHLKHFSSININNYLVKFHYYLQKFYKCKLNVIELMKYKLLIQFFCQQP
jgi:hypothetical protein